MALFYRYSKSDYRWNERENENKKIVIIIMNSLSKYFSDDQYKCTCTSTHVFVGLMNCFKTNAADFSKWFENREERFFSH